MSRRKKHEEHENHERWLVSYADFITLLFAFFTVLYATAQTDQKKLEAVVDGLNAAFDGGMPHAIISSRTSGTTNIGMSDVHQTMQSDSASVVESMKRGLRGSLSDNVVQLGMVEQSLVVVLPGRMAFAAGSAELHPSAYDVLATVAETVGEADATVEVSGAADATALRAGGPYQDNWALASARAGAAVRFLERRGIPREHLIASASVVAGEDPESRAVTLRIRAGAPAATGELLDRLDRGGLLTAQEEEPQ